MAFYLDGCKDISIINETVLLSVASSLGHVASELGD